MNKQEFIDRAVIAFMTLPYARPEDAFERAEMLWKERDRRYPNTQPDIKEITKKTVKL